MLNIFKKIKTIFNRDILFFVKTPREQDGFPEDSVTKTSEIYFKGAWEEDGVARWAFFKEEDVNNNDMRILDYSFEEAEDGNTLIFEDNNIKELEGRIDKEKLSLISSLKGQKLSREGLFQNLNTLDFSLQDIEIIFASFGRPGPSREGETQDFSTTVLPCKPEAVNVDIEKKSLEEVVSITEMGRHMTSRYKSDPEEDSSSDNKVIGEDEKKSLKAKVKASPLKSKAKKKQPALKKTYIKEKEEPFVEGLVDQRDIIGESNKIKVFFAEDNRSFQIILRTLINKTAPVELVGWAANGKDAVHKIKDLEVLPDVILMDIAMPKMDGIETTKELLKIAPGLRIVMLTAFGDKEHVQEAFRAGAVGFLRKDAGLPLIKEAIKQAARGGRPVHKEVSKYLEEE